jgi:hypothetical protein
MGRNWMGTPQKYAGRGKVVMTQFCLSLAAWLAIVSGLSAAPEPLFYPVKERVVEQLEGEIRFEFWAVPSLTGEEVSACRIYQVAAPVAVPLGGTKFSVEKQKVKISFDCPALRFPTRYLIQFLTVGGKILGREMVEVLPQGYLKKRFKELGLLEVFEIGKPGLWRSWIEGMGGKIAVVSSWDDERIQPGAWVLAGNHEVPLSKRGVLVLQQLSDSPSIDLALVETQGNGSGSLSISEGVLSEGSKGVEAQWKILQKVHYLNLKVSKGIQ